MPSSPEPELESAPADSYTSAVDELDEILDDLEGDDLDVDLLAARVRRAAELLTYCKSRIRAATDDVAQAVAALEEATGDTPGSATS